MRLPRSVLLLTAGLFGSAVGLSWLAESFWTHSLWPTTPSDWLAVLGIAVALVASGLMQVEFRRGDQVEAIDLFEAALMPALLLFAGPIAVVLAGIGKMVSQRVLRVATAKAVFNVAQWCFAVAGGSVVFTAAWQGEPGVAGAIPALLLAMVSVMALNHFAVVLVLALVGGRPAKRVVADLQPLIVPNWIIGGAANISLGLLFAALAAWAPPAVVIAVVPLLMFDAAHRASTAARTDRRRLTSLHRATAALAKAVDPNEAIPVVLDEVRGCFAAEAALVLLDDDAADPALRRFASAVVSRDAAGRLRASDPEWAAELERIGHDEVAVAPVRQQGRTTGVLLALGPAGETGSQEGESSVLAAFASELASAIERGRAVADAMAERRLLSQIFDTTSDGVCAVADDGTIATWNPAMEVLTGYGADELTTAASLAALQATRADGTPVLFDTATAIDTETGIVTLPEELRIRNRIGEQVWIGCGYAVAPSRTGRDGRMLVITMRDITQARERARLKDEFVAIASHELRTPATVVRGMAHSMLLSGDAMTDAQRRQAVTAIHRASVRLNRVVTNVLAVSRVEATSADKRRPVEIGGLCDEVVWEVGTQHDGAGDLVHVDPGVRGMTVMGDEAAINQILVNLLSNALKYGGGEPVTVAATATGGTVTIEVMDRGPGIPQHEQARIFERFERIHQHDMQAGTGLGLYIARRLAEGSGGTLEVESFPGSGATFVLTLPAAPQDNLYVADMTARTVPRPTKG